MSQPLFLIPIHICGYCNRGYNNDRFFALALEKNGNHDDQHAH